MIVWFIHYSGGNVNTLRAGALVSAAGSARFRRNEAPCSCPRATPARDTARASYHRPIHK
jgi:hypothetical protein